MPILLFGAVIAIAAALVLVVSNLAGRFFRPYLVNDESIRFHLIRFASILILFTISFGGFLTVVVCGMYFLDLTNDPLLDGAVEMIGIFGSLWVTGLGARAAFIRGLAR